MSSLIIKVLESYSSTTLAILTFFLVIITAYYAFWTYKMAKVMSKQLELESRPYAAFDNTITVIVKEEISGIAATETDWVQLKYSIINLGKVPLVYQVNEISVNGILLKPSLTECILYPSQTMFYTTEAVNIKNTKTSEVKGESHVKIAYWASNITDHKYFSSRKISFENRLWKLIEEKAGELN